jgi:hypothetical protein
MNFTRTRLAALAATVSALAIGVPAATANAQVPGFPTGIPSLAAPIFPTAPFPTAPFTYGATRLSHITGPTLVGAVLYEGIGAGSQAAAAAPQAVTALTLAGGGTIAYGG